MKVEKKYVLWYCLVFFTPPNQTIKLTHSYFLHPFHETSYYVLNVVNHWKGSKSTVFSGLIYRREACKIAVYNNIMIIVSILSSHHQNHHPHHHHRHPNVLYTPSSFTRRMRVFARSSSSPLTPYHFTNTFIMIILIPFFLYPSCKLVNSKMKKKSTKLYQIQFIK